MQERKADIIHVESKCLVVIVSIQLKLFIALCRTDAHQRIVAITEEVFKDVAVSVCWGVGCVTEGRTAQRQDVTPQVIT